MENSNRGSNPDGWGDARECVPLYHPTFAQPGFSVMFLNLHTYMKFISNVLLKLKFLWIRKELNLDFKFRLKKLHSN